MAKLNSPSILEVQKRIKKDGLAPVYYLYGEDAYLIDSTISLIKKTAEPYLKSDFDSEIFYGDKNNFAEVTGFAKAFPFGSEKKLILFKQVEKCRDKKELVAYLNSPAEFTVLVCIHNGTPASLQSEPYKTLAQHNSIFEAKELKGRNLTSWVSSYTDENGYKISEENAHYLTDLTGENRSLIENQLQKMFVYLGNKKEIDFETIKQLSSSTKEYSIFDLQNAVGKKDLPNSFFYAYHLMDSGIEPTHIISMLTRYFSGLSRIPELMQKKLPDAAAARIVGTHPYYYKDYLNARKIYSDDNLAKVFQSLLKADVSVKTSSADNKTIIITLLSEILLID